MTAVVSPQNYPLQPMSRTAAWGTSAAPSGLTAMNQDEVTRMFMPRKSAQRSNSSSSISSTSSNASTSTTTSALSTPQSQQNGGPTAPPNGADVNTWGTAAARKKVQRAGPWPSDQVRDKSSSKMNPQSILAMPNGSPTSSSMTSIHQPIPMVPSQQLQPMQPINGMRPVAPIGEEPNPVLYLLSMNGTFERKAISVPYYPDSLRIGRQTNMKTIPTPANGFFDSKVLSRQHAEIWADRNGKVYIRDVKSSNGTFVNGARLSPENKESEPHELQTQDHLELGIDIVSEDQKTVVHHKVAAKVEHAGHPGATNNIMEMNFGDLNPANGVVMLPSQGGMLQSRGRAGSQGSVNSRMGTPASVPGSQIFLGQQRQIGNFWLTPVTTEAIVKRLSHEMRSARLAATDLVRTDSLLGSLLAKEDIRDSEKLPANEQVKPLQVNGGSISFRGDAKARFSGPPAPPPQQPLPEKPDAARGSVDPSSPSLKRSTTERPRSVPNTSPVRQEPTSQIITLVEALASARKEIDVQSARMRDLEEMLQKERHARETAEDLAKRLELHSTDSRYDLVSRSLSGRSVLEDTFQPPPEAFDNQEDSQNSPIKDKPIDPKAIMASGLSLEKRLETMLVDMREMKQQMDSFRLRAETAENERDVDRQTLVQMVNRIRASESGRRSPSAERTESLSTSSADLLLNEQLNGGTLSSLLPEPVSSKQSNGAKSSRQGPVTLTRPPGGHDPFVQQAAPYASMLGVVLIGMGLMAYLNGWEQPKLDR